MKELDLNRINDRELRDLALKRERDYLEYVKLLRKKFRVDK